MANRVRRFGGLLLAAVLVLALAAGAANAQTVPTTTASSGGGGGGSSAVAVNKKDGSSVFKLAFSVRRVTGDTVDTSNAAVAYASCSECQTVAASIQVVLAMDDPSTVSPTNVALAINYQCNECDTLAAAYQIVFGDGQPVHFTPEGNRELAQEKKDLHDLKKQDLTLQQIADQIAAIAARVSDTVATQLVPAGTPGSAATTTTASPSTSTTAGGGSTTSTSSTERSTSTTASTAPTTSTTP